MAPLALIAAACLLPAVVSASPVPGAPLLTDLPVPGGVRNLLAAAGLRSQPDRSVALLTVIRLVHGSTQSEADESRARRALLAHLDAAAAHPAEPGADPRAETVPLPLSPNVWIDAVFKGSVRADGLLRAILADRHAALLYHGLMALDDSTLSFLAGQPSLLGAIADQGSAVFATYGRSIHVVNGAVVLPGGAEAAPLWESVVGAPAQDARRFILALLGKDGGRCAYFVDTITHLDPPRRAFALGSARPGQRIERFQALYAGFVEFDRSTWHAAQRPFARQALDPALLLMTLAVTDRGEMAPPAGRRLWEAALAENTGRCRAVMAGAGRPDRVDAAWLVDRLRREGPTRRRILLDEILFAQRLFSDTADADPQDACVALASFPQDQGLLLTLERLGVRDPADYAAGVRLVATVHATFEPDRTLSMVQVQAALAILERGRSVGALDAAQAVGLVRSLFLVQAPPRVVLRRLSPTEPRDATTLERPRAPGLGPAVAEWLRTNLLPALGCSIESGDACLVEAMSGASVRGRTPVITWEGQRYAVDYAAGAHERLNRVRDRQHPTRVSDALAVCRIASLLANEDAGAPEAEEMALTLEDLAGRQTLDVRTLFRLDVPRVRDVLDTFRRALPRIARLKLEDRDEAVAPLEHLGQVLLADALASFVYALAIGDPDATLLLAGDPARRHDFGRTEVTEPVGPWQPAGEVKRIEGSWFVQGSLLGLDRVLARSSLRRLSAGTGQGPSSLDAADGREFAASAIALDWHQLDDATRDVLVATIRRGRERIAVLAHDPDALAAEAAGIGLSEWRCRAAVWLARQPGGRPADLFSLTEMLWLGTPAVPPAALDLWGVATRALDGGFGTRLPRGHSWEDFWGRPFTGLLATQVADVNLRVAECLEELRLPSALVPGVVSLAAADLIDRASLTDPQDWLGAVRAGQSLSTDQVGDYVSALTAVDGPLVPTRGPQ